MFRKVIENAGPEIEIELPKDLVGKRIMVITNVIDEAETEEERFIRIKNFRKDFLANPSDFQQEDDNADNQNQ